MPDYCLICYTEISPQIGWTALISEEKEETLCLTCKGKLQKIEGPTCIICNRPLNQLDPRFIHDQTCNDCIRWEEDTKWQGCLQQNQSLFHYNNFLQEVIARFKFRGDYILAKIFSEWLQQKLNNEQNALLVPIPLSMERLEERGFNQAEALILEAGLQPANILTRIHTEKQSKKSRTERIHVPQVFQLQPNTTLAGKQIILFDDIYTTGSTLHHAAKLLKTNGAATISSITIARG
jgi:competence protein ComFC